MAFLVASVLTTCLILFTAPALAAVPYVSRPCETGWNHNPADDSCNMVFPSVGNQNRTGTGDAVPVTYWDAQAFCAKHRGAVPAIQNITWQLPYLMRLVRSSTVPGAAWWIGVHADRKDKKVGPNQRQRWVTPNDRDEGFTFRWDGSRHMPSYEGCVVMHMIGDKKHTGGNDKMITVDCDERHHVVCTKPRVEASLTMLDHWVPGRVEVLHGYEKRVTFAGPYIPQGLRVTMQTTDERNSLVPPRRVTHCDHIHTLTGASEPMLLNITAKREYSPLCNGTCQYATITFPASWPWVRGAQYSFCFFVPFPFNEPRAHAEWRTELMRNAYIEVVQKHTDYLRDVCDRRKANVNLFYGDGRTDLNRDKKTGPWYFDSPVERGGTPL